MKLIIVIRAYHAQRFDIVRDDLERQMKERGWELPVFCHLEPIEFEDIEIVWLDEQMEMDKFIESIKNARILGDNDTTNPQ